MVGDATTTAINGLEVLAVNERLLREHVGLELRYGHVPRSGHTNLSNVAQ